MRQFGKLFIVGLLVLTFNQSCTDLEEQVFSELTAENFPTTDQQFVSALGQTYSALFGMGNHGSFYSLNEISSDELIIPQRGNDWFDGGIWLRAHQHTFNETDGPVDGGWNSLYGGVNSCNRVIDLFEGLVADGTISSDVAAPSIAEVKVLRAYYYYWLLDMYGNVPIVTSFADSEPPATQPRLDVFNFVESELTTNVPLLSKAKDGTTYGRFNYYAGQALMARLYLNAEVYTGTAMNAKAITAADEVINSGLYNLEGDYFTNFNTDNSGSAENILVVPYDRNNAGGFNIAQMTLHYASQGTFNLEAQPWNGYCTLEEFYNSYDNSDLRKGVSGNQKVRGNFHAGPQYAADGTTPIEDSGFEPEDPDGASLNFTPEVNALFPNALRQAGARVGKYEFALGSAPNLDNDFVLLRYAEVLMNKAEALYRSGNSADALALVNQVRSRAGVADYTALDDDNFLAERGREFFFEGLRRPDLIRFGKFTDPWTFKDDASGDFRTIFPIPANQLGANPNLVQNPGY